MSLQHNYVAVTGRPTHDIELRQAGATSVVNCQIAVDNSYMREGTRVEHTAFVPVTVWGPAAENLAKLNPKGRLLMIEGSLDMDQWTDDKGEKKSKVFVKASSWKFVEPRKDGETKTGEAGP